MYRFFDYLFQKFYFITCKAEKLNSEKHQFIFDEKRKKESEDPKAKS